jgi:hypothetical protein
MANNFTVKYTMELDAEYLIRALKADYDITMDRTATKYIGLMIKWDLKNQKVHTSMPGYLSKAFLRFKHEISHKKQNSPHPHIIQIMEQKHDSQNQRKTSPPTEKKRQHTSK